jgi:NAD(P)H-hydrate epimerase
MDPSHTPTIELPRRQPDAHKGHFGLALIVGGSRGMSGAVALAGMAALRAGAGLVRLAVPDSVLDTVAGLEPSYMTLPLPADAGGRISLTARETIVQATSTATTVGLGPGIGRSLGLDALVGWLYANLPQPMVVDADGLNALAARPNVLSHPGGPRILTPHPGEFSRLVGGKRVPIEQREAAARDLASRAGAVVVLKGHRTCVTDGKRSEINHTGNPGMATGGSGDVLTGLIVALVCQGLTPFDAARLGVHLHGLAGDLAAEQTGLEGLIASDLVRFLPAAFGQHRKVCGPG